jgi:hypothetical protein
MIDKVSLSPPRSYARTTGGAPFTFIYLFINIPHRRPVNAPCAAPREGARRAGRRRADVVSYVAKSLLTDSYP